MLRTDGCHSLSHWWHLPPSSTLRIVGLSVLLLHGPVGCSTNSAGDPTVNHGSQAFVMFPGTEPQAINATEAQRPNEAAVETATYAPAPDCDERLGTIVSDARDLLLDNRELDAVRKLTDAKNIDGWSQSRHAPSVLFWLGHSYDRLGERIAAIAEYRMLVARYPESGLARRARQRLTYLEANSAVSEMMR